MHTYLLLNNVTFFKHALRTCITMHLEEGKKISELFFDGDKNNNTGSLNAKTM